MCLVREDNFDKHGVLEYNFVTLKEAISKVHAAIAMNHSPAPRQTTHSRFLGGVRCSRDRRAAL